MCLRFPKNASSGMPGSTKNKMFDKDVYSQHHLNRYLRFIESCKHQVIEGFCEEHHIKPRSLGGQDTFDNLVKLTYRQHFIAHLMLSKIFKGNSQIKMAHAAWNMVNRDGGIRTNSKTYSMLREKRSNILSVTLRGENNPMFGKKHSEESKRALSLKLKGKKKPESQREKLRIRNSGSGNPQYGKPKNKNQLDTAKKFMTENNPMFRQEIVNKIKQAKKGTVNCYDLIDNKYVRVAYEEFCFKRNTRYVGTASKRIPKDVRE